MRSALRKAAAVGCCSTLLVGAPGCSLLFVRGPPKDAAPGVSSDSLECTESVAAPVLDTVGFVVAGLAVAAGVAAAGTPTCPAGFLQTCHNPSDTNSAIIAGGVLAAAWAGSAVFGYTNTARCRHVAALRAGQGSWARPPPSEQRSDGEGRVRSSAELPPSTDEVRGGPEFLASVALDVPPNGLELGWRAAASAMYQEGGHARRPRFGWGLRADYASHLGKVGGSEEILEVAPDLRLAIMPSERLTILADVGLGFAYIDSSGTRRGTGRDAAEGHIGLQIGAGAAYGLLPRLDLYGEVRVHVYTYNPGSETYFAVPAVGIRIH